MRARPLSRARLSPNHPHPLTHLHAVATHRVASPSFQLPRLLATGNATGVRRNAERSSAFGAVSGCQRPHLSCSLSLHSACSGLSIQPASPFPRKQVSRERESERGEREARINRLRALRASERERGRHTQRAARAQAASSEDVKAIRPPPALDHIPLYSPLYGGV